MLAFPLAPFRLAHVSIGGEPASVGSAQPTGGHLPAWAGRRYRYPAAKLPSPSDLGQLLSFIRLLESAQDRVPALDHLVQSVLHGGLIREYLLETVAKLGAD